MKPQSKKLIDHFTAGESVTRDSAFHVFGIQNLTARLSELSGKGFDIIKFTEEVTGQNGRKIKVSHWRFRHIFNAGDNVQVAKDTGIYISLRGKIGIVSSMDRYGANVTIDFPGIGMRRVAHKHLARINRLTVGTPVELVGGPLVVGGYVPEGDSYLLFTPNPNLTVAASAALVRNVAPAQ
jgi:hypothetical protein